jgi:aryl-alcohol dehydrogenase-like predicted oxidoreductase
MVRLKEETPPTAVSIGRCGALSGPTERHPIASPPPEPIGSAKSYDADVARARRLLPLVKEGFAASLTEAATRFAISDSAMGTILVGMATARQFDDALAAVQKGRLPSAALDRLSGLQQHSLASYGDRRGLTSCTASVHRAIGLHIRWRATVIAED